MPTDYEFKILSRSGLSKSLCDSFSAELTALSGEGWEVVNFHSAPAAAIFGTAWLMYTALLRREKR